MPKSSRLGADLLTRFLRSEQAVHRCRHSFAFDVNTKAVCQYIQSVQLNFALLSHPFASFSRTNFCLPPA
jgi:hypothetical protein